MGEEEFKPYFTGELIPRSIGHSEIYPQYRDMRSNKSLVLDDFQNPALTNWTATDITLVEGLLTKTSSSDIEKTIDPLTPHDTRGIRVNWTSGGIVTFNVSPMDVSGYPYLSFRISYVADAISKSIDDLKIVLKQDQGFNYTVGLPRKIPTPDIVPDLTYTIGSRSITLDNLAKSALITIRIPLQTYQMQGLDLTKVKSVEFHFPRTGPGFIEIDELEFTH